MSDKATNVDMRMCPKCHEASVADDGYCGGRCREITMVFATTRPASKDHAGFLWPYRDGSVEEAGYELLNAKTETYRHQWWVILLQRMKAQNEKGQR